MPPKQVPRILLLFHAWESCVFLLHFLWTRGYTCITTFGSNDQVGCEGKLKPKIHEIEWRLYRLGMCPSEHFPISNRLEVCHTGGWKLLGPASCSIITGCLKSSHWIAFYLLPKVSMTTWWMIRKLRYKTSTYIGEQENLIWKLIQGMIQTECLVPHTGHWELLTRIWVDMMWELRTCLPHEETKSEEQRAEKEVATAHREQGISGRPDLQFESAITCWATTDLLVARRISSRHRLVLPAIALRWTISKWKVFPADKNSFLENPNCCQFDRKWCTLATRPVTEVVWIIIILDWVDLVAVPAWMGPLAVNIIITMRTFPGRRNEKLRLERVKYDSSWKRSMDITIWLFQGKTVVILCRSIHSLRNNGSDGYAALFLTLKR